MLIPEHSEIVADAEFFELFCIFRTIAHLAGHFRNSLKPIGMRRQLEMFLSISQYFDE